MPEHFHAMTVQQLVRLVVSALAALPEPVAFRVLATILAGAPTSFLADFDYDAIDDALDRATVVRAVNYLRVAAAAARDLMVAAESAASARLVEDATAFLADRGGAS